MEQDEEFADEIPADLEPVLWPEKLTGYVLDENATITGGANKARLFRSILDIGPDDWEDLRDQLLDGVRTGRITGTSEHPWGRRYQIQIPVRGNNDETANVDTVWQVEDGWTLKFLTVRTIKKDR